MAETILLTKFPCALEYFPASLLFIYLFIYLIVFLAALGLSCGMQDLHCGMRDLSLRRKGSSLWHTGFSLVVERGLCSCGAQVPEHVGSVICGTPAL